MKKVIFASLFLFLLSVLFIQSATAQETPGPAASPALDIYAAIGWAAIGVFISFIIPVLTKYRVQISALNAANLSIDRFEQFIIAAAPYAFTAVQSFLIAIVVIGIILSQGTALTQWYEALIAGYTFDATIQKVKP